MARQHEEDLISKLFYSYGAELHLVSSLQGKEFSEPHLGEIWEAVKDTYPANPSNWSYVELFSLKLSPKARETLGHISINEIPLKTVYLAEQIRAEAKLLLGLKISGSGASITLENQASKVEEIKELTALLEAPVTFETKKDPASQAISFLNGLQRDPSFIATHSPALNELMEGFQPGNLIVLAARPSVGKTAVALNLGWGIKDRANVAFYSLEMTKDEIFRRLASLETGIPIKQIRPKAEYETSTRLAEEFLPVFEEANFEIVTNPQGFTMADLRSHALKLKAEGNLDILFIDQLDKIRPSGRLASATEYEILTKHSTALKQLALELQIPVIVLAQINREGNEEPTLKHLKGSGQLEQDADLVFIIHRKIDQQDRETELSFTIAKNRQGQTGRIFYRWIGEQMKLQEPKTFGWNKPAFNPADNVAKTLDHQATFGTAIAF